MTIAETLNALAEDARTLRDTAAASSRSRPGHPVPLALADQAAALALAAAWLARESDGTMHHALPLVRARLRALTHELENL